MFGRRRRRRQVQQEPANIPPQFNENDANRNNNGNILGNLISPRRAHLFYGNNRVTPNEYLSRTNEEFIQRQREADLQSDQQNETRGPTLAVRRQFDIPPGGYLSSQVVPEPELPIARRSTRRTQYVRRGIAELYDPSRHDEIIDDVVVVPEQTDAYYIQYPEFR